MSQALLKFIFTPRKVRDIHRVLLKIWSRRTIILIRRQTIPVKRRGVVLSKPRGGGREDRHLLLGSKILKFGFEKVRFSVSWQSWFCSFVKEKQFHLTKKKICVMSVEKSIKKSKRSHFVVNHTCKNRRGSRWETQLFTPSYSKENMWITHTDSLSLAHPLAIQKKICE